MSANRPGQPPYTIRGCSHDGEERTTRLQAGSAMVLARQWIQVGYSDVTIGDASGKRWRPDDFLAQREAVRTR